MEMLNMIMNTCSLIFKTNNLPSNVLLWSANKNLLNYTFSVITSSSYTISSDKVYTSSETILNSTLNYNFIKLSQIVELDGKEFSRRYEKILGITAEEA